MIDKTEYYVTIEASDEADAEALKIRIKNYLKRIDLGDYSGRIVDIEKRLI